MSAMSADQETGRDAWEAWARREFGAQPDRVAVAVDAAVAVLRTGSRPQAAVVAARLSAGMPVPPGEVRALGDEIQTIERVIADLGVVRPAGDLTQAGLDQLKADYERRLDEAHGLYFRATGAYLGTYAALGRPVAGPLSSPAAPRPPGPSLREFFADNSILIISIAGAFLLIVATLLFEIYGTTGFGGEVRFFGVLALNLIFGAAGIVCLGRTRLRLVGQTYLAIFALMAPLTVAAAWVFLSLESRGISKELALGLGGLGCAILYAILATRLGSRGYATLSMVALPAAAYGLLAAAGAGVWIGPGLAVLVFVYIAIAYPPAGAPAPLGLFTRLAEPFIHGAAVIALVWSLGQAVSEWNAEVGSQPRPSFQLTAAMALLTVAYAAYCLRSRRAWMAWAVWLGISATVLAGIEPLSLGERGYVVGLVALAWAYALGARRMPAGPIRMFVRAGAASQAVIPALLAASPDGLQAFLLLAATGAVVFTAIDDRQPAWLTVAAGIFALDWYWLAKSLVPPPPQATADTLVLTYSPLPVLYGLAGLILRRTRSRWAWPLYAGGGLLALGVAVAAATQNDPTLAGRALLVYAGVAYAAAALDRWWPGLLAAIIAAASGVLSLLGAASVADAWYPASMTLYAVLVYSGHLAWRAEYVARVHRYSALAIAGLAAGSSFLIPDFWATASLGSLTGLMTVLAAAALLLVDGRMHRRPLFDYAAVAVASLGGIWIARHAGFDNLQAYVALPGPVFIALGVVAAQDARHPARLIACRAAVVAGAVALMGASAYQSVTENAAATYTTVWVIEAVAALLVGIGARSRTLVLVGGAGLALGALRALFLILESVQVYVVFGVIAIVLLVGAGVLAATRDRLAGAREAVSRSWNEWA